MWYNFGKKYIFIKWNNSLNEVKEMKKLTISALAAVMVVGSFGAVAEASTTDVEKLRDQLVSLGVPSNGANQLMIYLQSVKLSKADEAELESLVKQAYALIDGRTDLTTLSTAEKNSLMNLAKKASSIVGLVLSYDIVNGIDTITLVSANGQQILSLTGEDLTQVLHHFDGDMISIIEDILEKTFEVVIGSNTPGSVNPMPDTELEGTGVQLPTMVMAGSGLIVLAAGLMVVSKKEMQA